MNASAADPGPDGQLWEPFPHLARISLPESPKTTLTWLAPSDKPPTEFTVYATPSVNGGLNSLSLTLPHEATQYGLDIDDLVSLNLGHELRAVVVRNQNGHLGLRVDREDRTPDTSGGQRAWVWWADTRPRTAELPGGFLVFGEMLPGSTAVDLRSPVAPRESAVANGIYMMLLDKEPPGSDLFVVFRDETGKIVPWRNPAVLKRARASDARDPCPACGNTEWDTVEIRTGPEDEHYRHRGLICATCGLEYGGWVAVGRRRPGFEAGGD